MPLTEAEKETIACRVADLLRDPQRERRIADLGLRIEQAAAPDPLDEVVYAVALAAAEAMDKK